MRWDWRHPISGNRRYLRPPKDANRSRRSRGSKAPTFRVRPRRRLHVASAMAAPEERRSRPNLRLTIIGLIVIALFGVIVLRLWSLQVINGKSYAAAVVGNTIRVATVPAPRGDIVDRNGTVLVGNTTQEQVVLSRAEAVQHPSIIGQVAALVGQTPKAVKAALNDPQYSPYEPVPVLQNASPSTIQYLETHQSQYPGVSVQSTTQRTYPQGGTTATHILGYVSPITGSELNAETKAYPNAGYTQSSQVGQSGLEAQYQQYLRGKDGKKYLEVNAQGNQVGVLRKVHPTQGNTLVTNLDLGLQDAVQQDLGAAIQADRSSASAGNPPAINGAAVVLDVRTGAVLAMASYPTYNLNQWIGGITNANYKALQAPCNSANSGCPLDNYAIQGVYTPGSIFKLNTATAALQDGLISPNYVYNDTGSYTLPNCTGKCTFHDAPGDAFGPITIAPAISGSSDVFFYNLGVMFWNQRAKFGPTPIQTVAHEYSLGEKTGIDLPDEVAGQVDSPALENRLHKDYPKAYPNKVVWGPGYNLELAFGQGATVTSPIEQAVAYATFANGGTRYQPQIAAEVVNQKGKVVKTFPPKVVGHVALSPSTYQTMLQGFEGVISSSIGTANQTFAKYASPAVKAMNLGGKTGTGSVGSNRQPNAWFVSFGPNPNPQYAVVGVVAQGGYGAAGVAPAVAQIWNYLAAHPVGSVQTPTPTKPVSNTPPPGTVPTANSSSITPFSLTCPPC